MATEKYLSLENMSLYDDLIKSFISGKKFVGTQKQYEAAYANGEIPINTLIIITDDKSSSSISTA